MKVLFLADNFAPERNAQASRVYERACYWVKWGHEVTVITCAPNFPEGKLFPGYKNSWYQVETLSGIRVVRVKTFISANKGAFRRIADFLSYMITAFGAGLFQEKPDVVASTSPQFFAAVAAWGLSLAKRRPFVFELSDLWPASIVAVGAMRRGLALQVLERLELFLYSRAAVIVALTNAFKTNLVERGVPESKIIVVKNGVDLGMYKPQPRNLALAAELGISPDEFVLAYIGTLGMAHGLENVLACAETIQLPNVRFLLVGPGADREKLVADAARMGLKNVTFVPMQPKERMPDFWSLADVALIHLKNTPVFATVIPSKMFEAMGMGIPILLVTPEGEAGEILLEEDAGLWVPSGDLSGLKDAIHLLFENHALRKRLATNSLAASFRHSRETQAQEMIACIKGVMPPQVEIPSPSQSSSVSNPKTIKQ